MDELTRVEKETLINYNEAEDSVWVYTYNTALKKKLLKAHNDNPEEIKLLKTDKYGGMNFELPKTCFFISIRKKIQLTDEDRKRKAECMRTVRASHQF
jgi:hypothetical protein